MSFCSDSEVSESFDISGYPKTTFRISVCLRRFYSDVRQRCYVLVSRKRRVRWLEQRLKKLFHLPSLYLCANGHFLPSSEPLALLNPEDRIEVFPCYESARDDGTISTTDIAFNNNSKVIEPHLTNSPNMGHTNCEYNNNDNGENEGDTNFYMQVGDESNSNNTEYNSTSRGDGDAATRLTPRKGSPASEDRDGLAAAKRQALLALDGLARPPPRRRRRVRRRRVASCWPQSDAESFPTLLPALRPSLLPQDAPLNSPRHRLDRVSPSSEIAQPSDTIEDEKLIAINKKINIYPRKACFIPSSV